MTISSETPSISLMAAKFGLEDTISLHQNLCFRPVAAQGGIAIKVGAHRAAVDKWGLVDIPTVAVDCTGKLVEISDLFQVNLEQ